MPSPVRLAKEYRDSIIDLETPEGRKNALAKVAQMCIEGYTIETVGPKTEQVIEVQQKNPQAAIRAILELNKMAPSENLVFEVNILEDTTTT